MAVGVVPMAVGVVPMAVGVVVAVKVGVVGTLLSLLEFGSVAMAVGVAPS